MTVHRSMLDTGAAPFAENRAATLEALRTLDAGHAKALAGGGEKAVARHRKRGKLLPRERIELLLAPTARSSSSPRWPPGAATTRSARPWSAWSRASANSAKYAAAEAAARTVDQAVQTHGGAGLAQEYGVGALLVASRLSRIAPISREMILSFVAQHDLRLPRSY